MTAASRSSTDSFAFLACSPDEPGLSSFGEDSFGRETGAGVAKGFRLAGKLGRAILVVLDGLMTPPVRQNAILLIQRKDLPSLVRDSFGAV